jgi:hypothetical protein
MFGLVTRLLQNLIISSSLCTKGSKLFDPSIDDPKGLGLLNRFTSRNIIATK